MAAYRTLPDLFIDRRAALAGLGLLLVPAAARAACRPARVLFVCPAGTVKSAIAREALKQSAARSGLSLSVSSRGLHPEDHLSPTLAANLRRDGIDPTGEPLRALTSSDVAAADLVVAFDEAADDPRLRAARPWKTPSWNGDYSAAKTDLDNRLALLLAELKTRAASAACEGP